MELLELKEYIDTAICNCQKMLLENPNLVLSEGDFEKLLCNCISEVLNYDKLSPNDSYTVHTQISHYMDGKIHSDMRVDILLLQESKLRNCTRPKNFLYCNDSFALELKYLHEKDDIRKVRCDFCKRKDLDANSWLYVVVLMDYSDENIDKFNERKKKINEYAQELYDWKAECKESLYFRVLKKKPTLPPVVLEESNINNNCQL